MLQMTERKSYRFSKIGKASGFLLWMLLVTEGLMAQTASVATPDGFVSLQEFLPGVRLEVRYFGEDNFVGAPVDGYHAAKIYVTEATANALLAVQAELAEFGLGLKVFDAYRPQQAVDHFVRWAKALNDTKMKSIYYPQVAKENLFRDGYIAERSGHSRGSTVDLTIVDLGSGEELDMGSSWDFFDPKSWRNSMQVSAQSRANRNLLATVMSKHGFTGLKEEWWHFTLIDEPFPQSYFNFPIE
jgi:D-alanyl-D-alanine dipeptidase